ncbi:MAG TPA: SEC-C metal-binding domain-containing protein [Candidatus Paceibacterota bacterium]|nr:SEC-C metal-binding domain-containing protein [Candidatus Paceibacterota bacterium]
MTQEKIIQRLEDIASTPGFLYTLALLLRKDLFLFADEAADINWREKISFQEFTLLIGLMVKHKIDISFPTEKQSEEDTEEIYKLFKELHTSHLLPFLEGFKERLLGKDPLKMTDEEKEKEYKDFFGAGAMMTEPIFYGGSGAYDFQYTELAIKKYSQDSAWLLKNKGITLETATKIAAKLKKRSEEVVRNYEKPKSFEEFVKNFHEFYKHNLNIFCFSRKDLSEFNAAEVEGFIKAFSLKPGTVNENFTSVGQYNKLTSHPIIQLEDDLFFLPVSFLLTESIYESPFYWMLGDKSYKDIALTNRGVATEEIAYEMLLPIFGKNLFRDIKVQKTKAEDATDIDILAVAGNKAIVVQAKSKRLTELARLGDTEQLKKDFTDAIQKAYEQGLICRKAILNGQNKLIDASGNEIKLSESIDEVYLVCLTSDNYPALTNQVDIYLTKKPSDPFPIGVSLFDLDIITFYLKDPFELLYYLRQRISLSGYFKGSSEMALLGYHLNQKLYRIPNSDRVGVDEDFAQLVDANFPVLRGHHPKTEAIERLHHKWKNEKFDRLVQEIKDTKEPGFTDAIFYLYDLSGDSADDLIQTIEVARGKSKRDGGNHDFTMIFDNGKSGISFVSQAGSPNTLGANLMNLAIARKYKTKADSWLALGSVLGSGKMADALGFTKQPWVYDAELEKFSKKYLKQGTLMRPKGRQKIGRNDPCSCGRGRKYKKCCGK